MKEIKANYIENEDEAKEHSKYLAKTTKQKVHVVKIPKGYLFIEENELNGEKAN